MSDEDPTAFGRRGPGQRRGGFEEAVSQSRQLVDHWLSEAGESLRIRDVVDAIDESADDGQLQSNAVKSKLGLEPSVVR